MSLMKKKSTDLSSFIYSSASRKSSVAKVWIAKSKTSSESFFTVNNADVFSYFKRPFLHSFCLAPFKFLLINVNDFSIFSSVSGGGVSSQADALKLAISKCLAKINIDFRISLRASDYLTSDARVVQPKKAGLRKARKKEQFSKR
jgi:small subunit ribosomal protein S9